MGSVVTARGHPKVTAKHSTTFMITKDEKIGPRGDCIIAVKADKSASELPPEIKRLLKSGEQLVITLKAGKLVEKVHAWGNPSLTLNHPTDMVVRKSRFICGRTLAVGADKAAADLSREFIAALQNPATKFEMEIVASQ